MPRVARFALIVGTTLGLMVTALALAEAAVPTEAVGAQAEPTADLSIQITSDAEVAVADQISTLTVTVGNNGPDVARWLFVLVIPSLGVEAVDASIPLEQGTCVAAESVDCSLPTLAPGETVEISVDVLVQTIGMTMTTARVASSTPEPLPDPTPNSATLALEAISLVPDHVITVDGPAVARVGVPVEFVIRIHRRSGPPASHLTVVDVLPDELEAVEARFVVDVDDPGPDRTGACVVEDHMVSCGLGALEGDSAEVRVGALPVAPGRDLSQTAALTGYFPGATIPDAGWDASWETDITDGLPAIDLDLAVAAEWLRVSVGDQLAHEYAVRNLGDLAATGVTFVLEVPAQLHIDGASVDGGASGCSIDAQQVTCALDEIGPDEVAPGIRVDLTALAEVEGAMNVATVHADQPEAFDEMGENLVLAHVSVLGPESIGGTVTDAAGRPIGGVGVRAWQVDDRRLVAGSGLTRPDGTYEILGLEPDTYAIQFTAPVGSGLSDQWFDGQPSRSTATPVELVEGAEVVGIDAVWDTTWVTGRVTAVDGSGVEGVRVIFCRTSDTWWCPLEARTGPDGTYGKSPLLPGTYQVRFVPSAGWGLEPTWYDGVVSRYATTPVVLEAGGSTELGAVLRPLPTGSVSGRVIRADGSPLAGARVIAYGPHDRWVGSYEARTAADGRYTIDHVATDTYRVMVVAPTGSPATTWFGHPTRRLATPVVVNAGASTGIDVAFLAP